ncbi:hypothetical protein M3Y94_00386800 [Aphelenchoides besseyi]|nr:hypothetical protein M3Y94_00386800 [Aphelenchoides besseyi]
MTQTTSKKCMLRLNMDRCFDQVKLLPVCVDSNIQDLCVRTNLDRGVAETLTSYNIPQNWKMAEEEDLCQYLKEIQQGLNAAINSGCFFKVTMKALFGDLCKMLSDFDKSITNAGFVTSLGPKCKVFVIDNEICVNHVRADIPEDQQH